MREISASPLDHVLVRFLCRVGNIRSTHVVPKRAGQTDKMLLRPLMPRPFPKRPHEKHILHPSIYGKMEDMQQEPIRCTDNTGPGLEGSSTAAPVSILRRCCCRCCCCCGPVWCAIPSHSYSSLVVFFPPHIATGQNSDFSLLVLKFIMFYYLSCISVWL